MRTLFGLPVLLLFAAMAHGAEPEGPPPFVFVIDSQLDASQVPLWSMAMHDVALAHLQHERGNHWAAYQAMTGGPRSRFRFHIPVRALAEMDAWPTTREVAIDSMGKEAARATLGVLDSVDDPTDRLTAYSPQLSRPPAPRNAPHRNYWMLTVSVQKGKVIEYASLMARIRQAHEAHEQGAFWFAYSNAIGGEPSLVELFFPFDRFAELDDWPGTQAVLAAIYGPEEAGRILEALDAITETTSELWSLAPDLSALVD